MIYLRSSCRALLVHLGSSLHFIQLSERIGNHLGRQGLLVRGIDNVYLALDP